MNWFKTLAMYGHIPDELDVNDEDIKLVPNIIEKVLIPKLTGKLFKYLIVICFTLMSNC